MLNFACKKIALTVFVLLCLSVLTFALVHLSGDPAVAIAGEGASPDDIERIRQEYGLDAPLTSQYIHWAGNLLHGDLGTSFYLRESVTSLLPGRIQTTLFLGFSSLVIAFTSALALGMLCGHAAGRAVDRFLLGVTDILQSLPSFLVALALIFFLAVEAGLLPVSGTEEWQGWIMPITTLALYTFPPLFLLIRQSTVATLDLPHIKTFRSYALPELFVLRKHGFKHIVLPAVSLSAVQLGHLLSGSVVIESIFSIDGIGYLAWQSIVRSDIQVVQGIILVIALIYSILIFCADMVTALIDRRVVVHG